MHATRMGHGADPRRDFARRVRKYRALLIMMIPGLLSVLLFNYVPMYGVVIAFKDFKIRSGILGSDWAGMKYFMKLFKDVNFLPVLRNTILISLYKLFWGFPAPILFALLLNEMRCARYKKLVQTVSYLPHFMSWVVLGGIFSSFLALDGPLNSLISAFGGTPTIFLMKSSSFRSVLVLTDVWKGFGWGSIVYLAALSGVDMEMYEAATIDGANRYQRALYLTLPSIAPVIVISLILNMSGILNAGFDQIFNMYNASVMDVADIIDTYVYRKGLIDMEYSYSTAVGLFKSVVAMLMMIVTNYSAKLLGGSESTLW